MASDDLQVISANWLKSLEVASSAGDTTSFVGHFIFDGWFRGLYVCEQWKRAHKYSQIFYVFPGNSGHYQDKKRSVDFFLKLSTASRDLDILVSVTSS
jgi:hypothetical protein